ncbi:MAG: PAS domain-containing protein [Deinococcota bacterium]
MLRDQLYKFLDQLWHTHILFVGMNDAIEFVDVNTAFCALSGYSQQELIGTPLDTIFEVASNHLDDARASCYQAPQSPQGTVWTITRKNNSRLHMHLFAEWLVSGHNNRHKLIMLVPTSELTAVGEQLHFLSH